MTSTSNCKFKLNIVTESGDLTFSAGGDRQFGGFTVVRLGDT